MRKMHKIFALALGSVLSLSAFAACGGGDVNSTGDAQNYQICFDNLDDSISLDSSATQVAIADANVVAAYDEDGNPVNDWESIATYENGVFTGVSAGRVRYQLSDGTTGNIEVVAAYPTNPDYDYAGNALDFSETGDQGEKVLGRTHDPSLIEVRNERGESIYYMFSTGWSDQSVYNGVTTYGNAIHVSYDGMKTWEFLGRTFDYATRETEVVNSKIGEWLYGDFTSLNNFYPHADRSKNLYNIVIKGMKNTRTSQQTVELPEEVQVSETGVIDINLRDMKGNARKLTNLKGKVVIVDFTVYQSAVSASHNYMLRDLYDKYASRGLEIYQISLDADEHYWKTTADNLPWICVRDANGIYSSVAASYNVQNVPTLFLVNRNNELSARGETIKDLDAAVQKLL